MSKMPGAMVITRMPRPAMSRAATRVMPTSPAPIVQKLNLEFIKAMNMPEAKQRIKAAGYDIVGSTPAELDAFIKAEITRWAKVVKDSGATVNSGPWPQVDEASLRNHNPVEGSSVAGPNRFFARSM